MLRIVRNCALIVGLCFSLFAHGAPEQSQIVLPVDPWNKLSPTQQVEIISTVTAKADNNKTPAQAVDQQLINSCQQRNSGSKSAQGLVTVSHKLLNRLVLLSTSSQKVMLAHLSRGSLSGISSVKLR